MVIHCPNYTHRIPDVSPGHIVGGGLYSERHLLTGGYTRDFTVPSWGFALLTILANSNINKIPLSDNFFGIYRTKRVHSNSVAKQANNKREQKTTVSNTHRGGAWGGL